MKPSSLERESVRLEAVSTRESNSFAPRVYPTPEPMHETLTAEYVRIFKRYRGVIIGCAVSGMLFALLAGLGSQPLYRTRTSLEIKSLNGDFMDIRSVAPTGDNSAPDSDVNLQTQIKLLESDTLAQDVEKRLMDSPHPQFVQRQDLLSRMARTLHLPIGQPIAYTSLIADAANRVKVKPLGLTRLVEITCDSYDARFSALYCNTLTSAFEEEDMQTRSSEATKTSEWLTRQVADVREKAQATQNQLSQAVGNNGLMLSTSPDSVGEDKLRVLQDELVKAEADRMQKEAQTQVASSASVDSLPSVQDDPAHRAEALKLADLQAQVAALVPPLTEANPRVIHLRSQIQEVQSQLRADEASSTHRGTNEYAAAKERENMLRAAYQAQVSTVSSDLQKGAQVSLLRRELDSEQQLYQTLLQRAKEAGFASAMQASTIRIVDIAKLPTVPFSPARKLAGAIGLALGCLFGTGLAFYKERNNKVFRMPGDVERYLHVHEIGVIPAIQRGSRTLSVIGGGGLSRKLPHTASVAGRETAVELAGWNDRFSIAAEAYRNTTLSILLSNANKRSRSYVVSSPNAGEGKTTIVSNLGVALSKSKLRVVVVDGDLRRPNLHRAFGMSNGYGLRNILRGELDIERSKTDALVLSTALPNISIIPAGEGSEDSVELLHSSYFSSLLTRLTRDFDVVLIDAPPILHMADARILAKQSDGAILIFRAGATTREQAASARDLIDNDGVRLVGTILNDFDPNRAGQRNYYSSYYRYQQDTPDKAVAAL
jgi:succinoglycan biosynthesis transport protein ExoP